MSWTLTSTNVVRHKVMLERLEEHVRAQTVWAHWKWSRADLSVSALTEPPVLMAIISRRALVTARVDALHKLRCLRHITIVKHKTGTRWIASVDFVNQSMLLFVDVDADIHRKSRTETKAKQHHIFIISNPHDLPSQHIGDLHKVGAQIHIGSSREKRKVHENNTISTKIEKLSDHIVDPCRVGTLQPAVNDKWNVAIAPAATVGNVFVEIRRDATLRVSGWKRERRALRLNGDFLLDFTVNQHSLFVVNEKLYLTLVNLPPMTFHTRSENEAAEAAENRLVHHRVGTRHSRLIAENAARREFASVKWIKQQKSRNLCRTLEIFISGLRSYLFQ